MKIVKIIKALWLRSIICLGFLLLGAALFIFDGRMFSGAMHQVTPGGDVLSLMSYSYGPYSPYRAPSFRRWLINRLPIPEKKKFSMAMEMGSTLNSWQTGDSSEDALWCWVSLKDIADFGKSTSNYHMELVDSDGWVYSDSRYKAFFWQNVVPNLGVGAFQNFPRHEPQLTLRVYDEDRAFLGSFGFDHSASTPDSQVKMVGSLPQSRQLGSSEVILDGIQTVEKEYPPFASGGEILALKSITPRLKFSGNSQENWELVDMVMRDSNGNLSTSSNYGTIKPSLKPLSPYRDYWRWTLSFVETSNESEKRDHSVGWDTDEFLLPRPGMIYHAGVEQNIGDVKIRFVAIAGPGTFVYHYSKDEDDQTVRISSSTSELVEQPVSWKTDYQPQSQSNRITCDTYHIALEIEGLKHNQRISARWLDDKGNTEVIPLNLGASVTESALSNFKSQTIRNPPTRRSTHPQVYAPLKSNLKTGRVALRFVLHEVVHVEFEFKPDPAWFPVHLAQKDQISP